MKILEEIIKNNWDFVLYKTDEGIVINVVFYTSAIEFSRSFKLNETEANFSFEELKELSEKIRTHYELYQGREIIPVVSE